MFKLAVWLLWRLMVDGDADDVDVDEQLGLEDNDISSVVLILLIGVDVGDGRCNFFWIRFSRFAGPFPTIDWCGCMSDSYESLYVVSMSDFILYFEIINVSCCWSVSVYSCFVDDRIGVDDEDEDDVIVDVGDEKPNVSTRNVWLLCG
mgnify:FL=1